MVEQKSFKYKLANAREYSVDWVASAFVPVPADVFVVGDTVEKLIWLIAIPEPSPMAKTYVFPISVEPLLSLPEYDDVASLSPGPQELASW